MISELISDGIRFVQLHVMSYKLVRMTNSTYLFTPGINGINARVSNTGSIFLNVDPISILDPSVNIIFGNVHEFPPSVCWWRVRAIGTDNGKSLISRWSDARCFRVPLDPYSAIASVLNTPEYDSVGQPAENMSFTWFHWRDDTKYRFELARDPKFRDVVVTANLTATEYVYSGSLDYNTKYFWRVKPIELHNSDILADWSYTYPFTTEARPVRQPQPVLPPTPDYTWLWIAAASITGVAAAVVIIGIALIRTCRKKSDKLIGPP